MRKLLFAGLAVSALSLAAFTPAQAQGGCGPYAHRTWNGFCRPYVGPVVVAPVVGYGYGYGGWHRPYGYGYGWHRAYGWHRW